MNLDNLSVCGLRVICILLIQTAALHYTYRIYTSDGGFTDYLGFDSLPEAVKEWMLVRNIWEYVVPSPCMFISGCKVHDMEVSNG